MNHDPPKTLLNFNGVVVVMENKEQKTLRIDWLGSCPKCDCSEHIVKTIDGSEKWLYSDDEVTCGECGHEGLIDADGEAAWVEWDSVEN